MLSCVGPLRLSTASANLSVTVPAIAAELDGAFANYSAARPCMVALQSRLEFINNTVVVLPANISVRLPFHNICLARRSCSLMHAAVAVLPAQSACASCRPNFAPHRGIVLLHAGTDMAACMHGSRPGKVPSRLVLQKHAQSAFLSNSFVFCTSTQVLTVQSGARHPCKKSPLCACMQSAALELQAVTDTLDLFLLNGTSPVPALAAQLTNLTASLSLAPFDNTTLTSLNTAQVLLLSVLSHSAANTTASC